MVAKNQVLLIKILLNYRATHFNVCQHNNFLSSHKQKKTLLPLFIPSLPLLCPQMLLFFILWNVPFEQPFHKKSFDSLKAM